MKTASAKNKGRILQKYIVAQILNWIPGLTEKDVTSTSMGAGGVDIKLSEAARRKFPFAIEAKNQEKINLWASWEQATINAKKEQLTAGLVIKKNGKYPVIVIDLATFMELVYRTYGKETKKAQE